MTDRDVFGTVNSKRRIDYDFTPNAEKDNFHFKEQIFLIQKEMKRCIKLINGRIKFFDNCQFQFPYNILTSYLLYIDTEKDAYLEYNVNYISIPQR